MAQYKQERTCSRCGTKKPYSDFHKDSNRRSGVFPQCKDCKREYDKMRQDRDRDKRVGQMRAYSLLARFGITEVQYDEMLEAQRYGCAICGAEDGYGGKRLAVDHCHSTGIVRGLLCDRCNLILGKAQDDPDLLRKAIEYLA